MAQNAGPGVAGPAAKPAATTKTPAPATAAKDPKAAKPASEKAVVRPRLPKYPDEHLITVIKEGAKARGAHDRFMRYATGMTVKAYVEKIKEDFGRTEGQTYADMRWDEEHKFIHIGEKVIDVPKPQPAPAAQAQPHTGASPTA